MSLELRDVAKSFGGQMVLDGISLTLAAQEFVVVLGPSGCGKTTMLRAIAGLEQIDAGSIAIGGAVVSEDGQHTPPEARNVGVVFQSYALWPHMSVTENVAFPMRVAGQHGTAIAAAVAGHLETVELTAFAGRKPAELSGGQRQRVALARCLAQNAAMVLMDEPLANLDPHLRSAMETELQAFREASKATILYITHDQREAMALADRVAVMFEGQLEQIGAPEDVYMRPLTERVTRFIGRSAIVDGQVVSVDADAAATVRIGEMCVRTATPGRLDAGPVRVVIRPGDAVVAEVGRGTRGSVRTASYRGGAWELGVAIDGVCEPIPVSTDRRARVGETVPIILNRGWVLPATA